MKTNVWIVALAVGFALAAPAARAQDDPVMNSFRQVLAGQERNLAAGAEEMPAEKYGYKPTPEQMSFGRMVLHIAQSSSMLCSRASGEKAPSFAGLTETSPKEKLIGAMRSAFSFCDQALAKVNDSDLSGQVPFFGGRMAPKAAVLLDFTDDLADHYSQESIYLRINGHLPPTAMRGRGMGGGMRRGGMGGGR
jgi:DinB superfamily